METFTIFLYSFKTRKIEAIAPQTEKVGEFSYILTYSYDEKHLIVAVCENNGVTCNIEKPGYYLPFQAMLFSQNYRGFSVADIAILAERASEREVNPAGTYVLNALV